MHPLKSSTLPPHSTRYTLIAAGLLLNTLITGCQSLPNWFDSDLGSANHAPTLQRDPHAYTLAQNQTLIGSLVAFKTAPNDTLPDIARHFGLGYNDISLANPKLSAWTPAADSLVVLPLQFILPDTPRKGIALNLASMRLFFYPKDTPDTVFTYPVGIGRDGWNTPDGLGKNYF